MLPRDKVIAFLECNGSAQPNISKVINSLCNDSQITSIRNLINNLSESLGLEYNNFIAVLNGALRSPAATDSIIIVTEPEEDARILIQRLLGLVRDGAVSVVEAGNATILAPEPGHTLPGLIRNIVSVNKLPYKIMGNIIRGKGRGKAVEGDTLYIRVWRESHPDPSVIVADSTIYITYGDWLRGLAPVLKKLIEGYVKHIVFFDVP